MRLVQFTVTAVHEHKQVGIPRKRTHTTHTRYACRRTEPCIPRDVGSCSSKHALFIHVCVLHGRLRPAPLSSFTTPQFRPGLAHPHSRLPSIPCRPQVLPLSALAHIDAALTPPPRLLWLSAPKSSITFTLRRAGSRCPSRGQRGTEHAEAITPTAPWQD